MQEPWYHNTGSTRETGYGGEVYWNTVLPCCVCRVALCAPDIPVSTGGKAKLAKALTDWVVASDLRLWMCELMTTVHERDSAVKVHVRSSLEEESVMVEIVQQTRDGQASPGVVLRECSVSTHEEKLTILHMKKILKTTRSGGPVKWTPYVADLDNAHRDTMGKWC